MVYFFLPSSVFKVHGVLTAFYSQKWQRQVNIPMRSRLCQGSFLQKAELCWPKVAFLPSTFVSQHFWEKRNFSDVSKYQCLRQHVTEKISTLMLQPSSVSVRNANHLNLDEIRIEKLFLLVLLTVVIVERFLKRQVLSAKSHHPMVQIFST